MAEKQILRILDDLSPSDLKLKSLPRKAEALYNFTFNEYGQLVKRKGYAKYNTTSIGAAHKITGMQRFYGFAKTTKEFIVAWNTKWYKIAATTPWGATALLSKFGTDFTTTADQDTYWADFKDRTYGVNSKGFWKYNRTYVRTVGIAVPTAPTYTSQTNGSLTAGDYLFKVTYVDEDGFESDASVASAAMTAGADPNDGLIIVIPTSSDDKVDKRRIYRTEADNTTYYYDGEVADNSTTAYTSTISDAALIVKTALHTDHTIPPTTPHLITKRRSRIVLAEDEDLRLSKLISSEYEYFPTSLTYPTGNKQKITGLKEQLTTLPAFTDDSLERLTGFDTDSFQFKNTFSNEGCMAPRSLANCKNLLVYLGYNGIYYFDGTAGMELSKELSEYVMENINATYMDLSCGVFYEDKYLLTYPKGASAVPNETVYFDFRTKTTGVFNLGFSCYSIWDKGGDSYSLKGGSNTIGRIYKVFDGLDDDGSAIVCYDDVEPIDLGIPDRYKKWYAIYIKIKTMDGIETATGLTIGTTTTKVASSAFTYSIAGTQYSKAAVAAGTTPGNDVIPEDKYGCVAFDIGTNETIDAIEASANATGYVTAALAVAGLPAVASGHVRMGYVTVMKSDGTFTFGTTSLSATNVTTAYTDLIGITLRMYYSLDYNTETYVSETLDANTTAWYKIGFGSAGLRARALGFKPYLSNKYDCTIMGYALVFYTEPAEWKK